MLTLTDIERRLENLIRFGVVDSIDHVTARCVVKTGNLVTTSIPWLTHRAGGARTWWAPTQGEQVVLFSPGGDPARAVVLPALYSISAPRPEDMGASAHGAVYNDGAEIAYDPATHQLTAVLPTEGTAHLSAPGGTRIDGDVFIAGKLTVTKDIDSEATITGKSDVVGGGISLEGHKHSGVQSDGSLTGGPQ